MQESFLLQFSRWPPFQVLDILKPHFFMQSNATFAAVPPMVPR